MLLLEDFTESNETCVLVLEEVGTLNGSMMPILYDVLSAKAVPVLENFIVLVDMTLFEPEMLLLEPGRIEYGALPVY